MHLEGENAALKCKVETLQETASLTDCLACHHVHCGIFSMPKKSSQQLLGKQRTNTENSAFNQEASTRMKLDSKCAVAEFRAFHWTGVNVCDVARQRDEAMQEATASAAEVARAQRELFLIRTQLHMARAAEESAAQVRLRCCHQLPVCYNMVSQTRTSFHAGSQPGFRAICAVYRLDFCAGRCSITDAVAVEGLDKCGWTGLCLNIAWIRQSKWSPSPYLLFENKSIIHFFQSCCAPTLSVAHRRRILQSRRRVASQRWLYLVLSKPCRTFLLHWQLMWRDFGGNQLHWDHR